MVDKQKEAFVVHLDGVAGAPPMILAITATENEFPLMTDAEAKPQTALQETLLKFMGVIVDLFQDNPKFKEAAAKWGLVFCVEPGEIPTEQK